MFCSEHNTINLFFCYFHCINEIISTCYCSPFWYSNFRKSFQTKKIFLLVLCLVSSKFVIHKDVKSLLFVNDNLLYHFLLYFPSLHFGFKTLKKKEGNLFKLYRFFLIMHCFLLVIRFSKNWFHQLYRFSFGFQLSYIPFRCYSCATWVIESLEYGCFLYNITYHPYGCTTPSNQHYIDIRELFFAHQTFQIYLL